LTKSWLLADGVVPLTMERVPIRSAPLLSARRWRSRHWDTGRDASYCLTL